MYAVRSTISTVTVACVYVERALLMDPPLLGNFVQYGFFKLHYIRSKITCVDHLAVWTLHEALNKMHQIAGMRLNNIGILLYNCSCIRYFISN